MVTEVMKGKVGIITGIANERSLAWGIAQALSKHGAELIITYLEPFKQKISPLLDRINAKFFLECDVADEQSIDQMFSAVKEKFSNIDFLVHAVAFSDKEELKGKYLNTSLKNFLNSMKISCYSFTALAQRAEKIMSNGGSLLTLSYYGAEKVIPHYNVMGVCKAALETSVKYLACDLGTKSIRVNAISAGPVRTLASSGIEDFHNILKWNKMNAPLKRNTTLEDVGGAALYLLSDLGQGTTGEILHVDSGYHTLGMASVDLAQDIIEYMKSKEKHN